ncbi:NAD(P)-dependent oxidoreductase [bacterium]|nr:NAD(P)-dependent oxidoreductase [bacterium]
MKALITGAGGFIGKNLTQKLASMNWQIVCTDLRIPDIHTETDSIKWVKLDCRKPDDLQSVNLMHDIDVIFHLAGLTRAVSENSFIQANVMTTQFMLDEIERSEAPIKRFVLVSSLAAAGPASSLEQMPVEKDEAKPVEAYGRSKLAAESLLHDNKNKIPYTIIRPGSVYGTGDRDFIKPLRWICRGIGIFPGTFNQWISAIYIDDLITGMIQAAVSTKALNQKYFLCNRDVHSWPQIYDIMAAITDSHYRSIKISGRAIARIIGFLSSLPFIHNIPPVDAHKISLTLHRYWVASPQKAIDDFDFKPDTDLKEGFEKTIEWYRKQGWLKK